MSDERAVKIFELDGQIRKLEAELRDLAERAAAASGSASEERLNDMITEAEAALATLRELRAAHASAITT